MGDADGIDRLLASYGQRIDAGDFVGVGALFADGALADAEGTVLARGADEVARFYASITRLHDGTPGTRHLVLETRADDEAQPDGTVTVRSVYLVLQGLGGEEPRPIISGRYVDRVAPDPASASGWRFVERRFVVDIVGDLSRHLTIEL